MSSLQSCLHGGQELLQGSVSAEPGGHVSGTLRTRVSPARGAHHVAVLALEDGLQGGAALGAAQPAQVSLLHQAPAGRPQLPLQLVQLYTVLPRPA